MSIRSSFDVRRDMVSPTDRAARSSCSGATCDGGTFSAEFNAADHGE
ncbi:MAG TPA: hypothetical protein VH008_16825 [Pseudonocardia sp.]|nr:hypothetical protein [Pseudonocardia sp.]